MKPFKFLTREQYNSLSAKEQADYDKAVKEWVDDFRAAHPNGLTVTANISSLNITPNAAGRLAVLVVANDWTPSPSNGISAFTFSASQLDRIATTANVPNAEALYGVIASVIEPCKFEVVARPVLKGEEYTKADGTKGTYEVSLLRYEGDKIIVSEDGKDFLADVYRDVVKDSVRGAFARNRRRVAVKEEKDPIVTP